jgi:hypothetical protein
MLTIEIETGNEAFADGKEAAELARILQSVARRLDIGVDINGAIYDSNGNRVGYCEYAPGEYDDDAEEEDAGPSRAEVDAALMRMPYHRAKALLAKYHVTSLDMLSDIFLLDVLNEARGDT